MLSRRSQNCVIPNRYKDHEEWTELFDLANDPYELKNLYHEASAAQLRARLEAEYAQQQQAVGYVWPAYASDPIYSGASQWPPATKSRF